MFYTVDCDSIIDKAEKIRCNYRCNYDCITNSINDI